MLILNFTNLISFKQEFGSKLKQSIKQLIINILFQAIIRSIQNILNPILYDKH